MQFWPFWVQYGVKVYWDATNCCSEEVDFIIWWQYKLWQTNFATSDWSKRSKRSRLIWLNFCSGSICYGTLIKIVFTTRPVLWLILLFLLIDSFERKLESSISSIEFFADEVNKCQANMVLIKHKFIYSPCNFSPLSEIPGSIELLENSLTYEGVQWRKIIECIYPFYCHISAGHCFTVIQSCLRLYWLLPFLFHHHATHCPTPNPQPPHMQSK